MLWRHKKTFLLLLLLFPFVGWAAEDTCSEFLLKNQSVVAALQEAVEDDYKVELFRAEINGQEKLVVLLGEVHIKKPSSAAIGRNVVSQFDYVGREGFDPSLTWGGKFDQKITAPLFSRLGISPKKQFWLAQTIAKLWGKKGRTEGSTIDEAHLQETRNKVRDNLDKMPEAERTEFITTLKEVNPDATLTLGGQTIFTVGEILAYLKGDPSALTAVGPKKTFDLEEGHKPDLSEHIDSVESRLYFATVIPYLLFGDFLPSEVQEAVNTTLYIYVYYSAAGTLAGLKFSDKTWFRKIFPLSVAILHGRNKTMVRNIDKTLRENAKVTELLAIVGMAHVPEMRELLIAQGYTPVSKPWETEKAAAELP